MTTLRTLILTLFSIALAACSSSCAGSSSSGKGVTWPKVAHCVPTASDAIGTVQRILLGDGDNAQTSISDRAKAELEGLAVNHGAQAVACLVDQVIKDWTSPGAAASPERAAATERGRDFLNDVGTRIERDDTAAP